MDFADFLSFALGIVSIATLAGLGFMRGTVVNLREQLKDARDEIGALKQSRTDDKTKAAQLETDLAALTRVVTGEAHWVAIGEQLEQHHTQATEHWQTDEVILTEIRDELRSRP